MVLTILEDGTDVRGWTMPDGGPLPTTRKEAIAIIDRYGKRTRFIEVYGRGPEEYYDEYSYEEPSVWLNTFSDMGIRVK